MEMPTYDKLADEFARHRRAHRGVLDALLANLCEDNALRVLEVGCGTGNYISAIRVALGCDCRGVDPSGEMLRHARVRSPEVQYDVGRAESLPCPDGTIDVVFSVDVIHHVSDIAAYFREAQRVLKSGGRVCTVTESEALLRGRIHAHYFPETVEAELRRYPPIDELHRRMEQVGFGDFVEQTVEYAYELTDIQSFKDKAFSSLHHISADAFQRGIEWMERDLQQGPLKANSRYVLVWGTKSPAKK